MKKYPVLNINLGKLKANVSFMADMCNSQGVDLAVVTKGFCAIPEVAEVIACSGAYMLADSRIDNLAGLADIDVPKLLLRIPMMCEIEDVVLYADISQNSEIDTIKALGECAIAHNKLHDILLMVDLGDLREGVWADEAVAMAGEIIKCPGIRLRGISTNLTCYGAIIPKSENLGLLCSIAEEIETTYNIKLDIVSGGNSSSVYLLGKNELPKRINQLRVGEAVLLGTESAYSSIVEGMNTDVFTIDTQIIELKEKRSVPIGEVGVDAFGGKPTFIDRGIRKRAIVAIGRQDISWENMRPIDKSAIVLGASSDHLILDVSDCENAYQVGDIISFTIGYGSLLQASTSKYVAKNLI